MPTLELKNVSYANEKSKAVLSNVSAELETGKMYAILGPSGSGKTTLLSLMGGLDIKIGKTGKSPSRNTGI